MKLNIGLFNESFPPTIDGVSNAVLNYATYITENHAECTVVTPRYPHVTDDYPFEVYRYSSADVSKKLGYRVGNFISVKTLHDLNAKHFDIIHVHSPFASSLIADELKKLNAGIPIVFTYHTKFDIDFQKRLKIKSLCSVAEKFICRNINKADEVWVVSEGAAQSLRNIGYKGAYRVMKNGTDFARGKATDDAIAEIRSQCGVDDDTHILLFVGRMMWYKNTGLILDALSRLTDNIKYKMVFVGDGVDKAAIEQYADKLGLADKTYFAGAVRDREKLRAYYSAADLFVFPSTYDTAGLVVTEAAACDLPSVLIDGSCAAEDVVDDFSGFLCYENPQSLADKIAYALSDDYRLEKIGKNAGESIYLSWEESVARAYKRYCEIYNEYHQSGAKKSLIQKVMPSNIKSNIKGTVNRSRNNAAEQLRRASNAGRTAAGGVKSTAENIQSRAKSAASSVKNGVKRTADKIFAPSEIKRKIYIHDKEKKQ